MKSVVYSTTQYLPCACSDEPDVILCLSDSDLLPAFDCPGSGETEFPLTTIPGSITKAYKDTCGCNVIWKYVIQYDNTLLADPDVALTIAQIVGIFCTSCLTTWVTEQVGDEVHVVDNGDDTFTLVSQHGCEYLITGGSAQTPLAVSDTSTVDLTIGGTIPQTLSADVEVSADANNAIEVHADGLWVDTPAAGGVAIGDAVGSGTPGGNLYVDSSGNLAQDTGRVIFGAALDYNPTNFHPASATQKVWLKCYDATFMTKAGGGTPANGDSVESIFDSDGTTIKFQQPNGAIQPTFETGATPAGTPALKFSIDGSYMESTDYGYLKNSNYVSLGAVFKWTDAANVKVIYRERDGTDSKERLSVTNGSSYAVRYTSFDTTGTTTTQDTLKAGFQDSWHVTLIQWNVYNVISSIYLDGYPTRFVNGIVANGGPISNTDAFFCRLGGQLTPVTTTGCEIADFFIFTGGLMSDWERIQWFAAIKAKFGITYY